MKIRVGDVAREGDCNFCSKNPGSRITILGGRSLDICICDKCLAEVKQQAPANKPDANKHRPNTFIRNNSAFLPDYTKSDT